MVSHETPSHRPQPAELELFEEDLPKGFLLLVTEQDLPASRSGHHMNKTSPIRRLPPAESVHQKLACLPHTKKPVIPNFTAKSSDYGYRVVEDKLDVHDLHANMLHLLGINHEKLTVRFSGRDRRLTDGHGHIVPEIVGT
ncbi:MAG: hypothetical protein ACI9MB_005285 [Verrucomicrobiales bacterium]|jgi:hypothetical protein